MSGNYERESTRSLLVAWAAILRELRRRGVVRTANNPIGDIAEMLVAEHFGGTREGFSNPGWDVTTDDGSRLEVKAMRLDERKRTNLSPIPATSTFTKLVIVIFDQDSRVTNALLVPRMTVEELFKPRPKDGARVVRVNKRLMEHPSVEPIDLADDLLDADPE